MRSAAQQAPRYVICQAPIRHVPSLAQTTTPSHEPHYNTANPGFRPLLKLYHATSDHMISLFLIATIQIQCFTSTTCVSPMTSFILAYPRNHQTWLAGVPCSRWTKPYDLHASLRIPLMDMRIDMLRRICHASTCNNTFNQHDFAAEPNPSYNCILHPIIPSQNTNQKAFHPSSVFFYPNFSTLLEIKFHLVASFSPKI